MTVAPPPRPVGTATSIDTSQGLTLAIWQRVVPAHATDDIRDRFVIASHHPDRLRRPSPCPGDVSGGRFQQALVWNTFRTLELLPPAFWLRRFQARLTGQPELVPPQIVRVSLWQPLPLPPIQRIDGDRREVVADVLIETEHAVWTLTRDAVVDDARASESIAGLVDAGGWFAGVRPHYCGVIESTSGTRSLGAVVHARYSRTAASARLRSGARGQAMPPVQWGGIRWVDLSAVLQDCRDAALLSPIERALAGNAVAWLTSVGVAPAPDRGFQR